MFVVITSYSQPPEIVAPHFSEHCEWLHKNINCGNFLASGPKKSGLGGVFLASSDISKAELKKIIQEDSYAKADVADYLIIEMDFKLASPGLEKLLCHSLKCSL